MLSLVYEKITTFLRRPQLDIIKVIYTPFDFTNLTIACVLQYVAQKILKNEHHSHGHGILMTKLVAVVIQIMLGEASSVWISFPLPKTVLTFPTMSPPSLKCVGSSMSTKFPSPLFLPNVYLVL